MSEFEGPRWLRRLSLVVAMATALAFAAYIMLTQTAWGRARVAAWLAAGLSLAIPGEAEVGSIEYVSLQRVELRNLRFFSPTGKRVIDLDRVHGHYDLTALVSRRFVLTRANIDGGRLHIEENPDGSVPLEQAFATHAANQQSQGGGSRAIDISLRDLDVAGLHLDLDLQGMSRIPIHGVTGKVHIELPHGEAVELRFVGVSGRVPDGPLTAPLAIRVAHGVVRGQVKRVLTLDADVSMEGEEFGVSLEYYDRQDTPVVVRVGGLDVSLTSLKLNAAALLSSFVENVDLDLVDAHQAGVERNSK